MESPTRDSRYVALGHHYRPRDRKFPFIFCFRLQFDEPSGIAIGSNGLDLLYVADTNNHVVKVIDPNAETIETVNYYAFQCTVYLMALTF